MNARGQNHCLLAEKSRRDFSALMPGMWQEARGASLGTCWGSDGASLESVSAFAHDPIASSPNLYAYCWDNPLTWTDPTGLYAIDYVGDWTPGQKDRIEASLKRIRDRATQLRDKVQADLKGLLKTLPPSCSWQLVPLYHTLLSFLDNVIDGIDSTEPVKLYHWPFNDPDTLAYTRRLNRIFLTPHINLNDDPSEDWRKASDRKLDETIFHELTHLYGSTDNTRDILDYGSAHILDSCLYSNNGLNALETLRNQVIKSCGCQKTAPDSQLLW